MISSDLYLFSSANTPAIYSLPVSHSISKIPPSPSRCLLLYETARLGFRDGRVGHDSQDSDQSGMAHQRTGPMKRVSQPYDRGRALRAHDIGPAGEMPGALCGGDDGLSHSAQWHKAWREGEKRVDVLLSARNLPRPDKRPPDADSDERASTNGLLSAVPWWRESISGAQRGCRAATEAHVGLRGTSGPSTFFPSARPRVT